jgi:drug/metabolite transporter (DMT)-like permease
LSRRSSLSINHFVLIGAQLAVGSAALMARAGLDAGLGALALSAWRLTVASLLLTAVLFFNARRRGRTAEESLDLRMKARLVLAGVCLGLHFAAWFASLQVIPVARSTLLVATTPVFAGLAGILFLRHRLPGTFWAGLAIAAIGVYLITTTTGHTPPYPPLRKGGVPAAFGDMMAIVGAVFIAAYLLLVQDVQTRLGTWRTIAWTYSAAALAMWLVVLLSCSRSAVLPLSDAAWFSVFGMALVPQLMGHTAINWSLKRFPAGAVAASTLLEPVFAAALAWWLLHEPVTLLQTLGAVVLLLGVGLSLRCTELPVEEQL